MESPNPNDNKDAIHIINMDNGNENNHEVTRDQAFSSFLTNEDLCDIVLVGSDGVRVPANRYILSARSNVFRSMLLGGFSEAQSAEIPIGYSGAVLKAIVEYILTDTADILKVQPPPPIIIAVEEPRGKPAADDPSLTDTTHTTIQSLVFLAAAALYFNLSSLCQRAHESLSQWLWSVPALSFVALESCKQGGPAVPTDIEELALSRIRCHAMNLLTKESVASLSSCVLQAILQDEKIEIDEYQLFEMVHLWATATAETDTSGGTTVSGTLDNNNSQPNEGDSKEENADNSDDSTAQDRRSIASNLVQYIHLEWIDPRTLSTAVAESGLVAQQQLFEAFQRQALAAQQQHGVTFQRPRYTPPVWHSSLSDTLSAESSQREESLLKYPPMSSGIHQWTILIEERCYETFLGIASSTTEIDVNGGTWLGRQERCWMDKSILT